MAAKLKVFVTSDGLTEYAVATSSRPKALAAWGVHQDLFSQGAARETDDPALVKAASARPGEVIERPVNSAAAARVMKSAPRPAKREPSKAALKQVTDLEARLEAFETSRRAQVEEFDHARAALEARAEREAATYDAERKALRERLAKARAALKP